MKIKVAILESDINYLNRIVSVFSTKYADKFEIYSFTDLNNAIETINISKIDVLIASDNFEIDILKIPERCSFVYFVDAPEIEMLNGQRTICKFQKADLIYKQILSVYSETAGKITGLKFDGVESKVIVFSSPSGGVGNSTMAAACASYYASNAKRTLYLNLEKYGSSDVFFKADGQFDISDIIYVLKSKKANLSLKLESCVRQDSCGVYFYSQPKVALDMLELDCEDVKKLINELKITGSYDLVIIDCDFGLEESFLEVYRLANSLVWICDGSETSIVKNENAYKALNIIEQNADSPLTNRLNIIYNMFSNKTSRIIESLPIKNVGGIPRYDHATTIQIMKQLSSNNLFEDIE